MQDNAATHHSNQHSGGKKRISPTKVKHQARRTEGLCFSCAEKYGSGNRCKRELQLLLEHKDDHETGLNSNEEIVEELK